MKKMRKGFIALELMITLSIVLVLVALASVKMLETQKENALDKLYSDTTQLLNYVVATDNINSYIGFLRAGADCLDANMYDVSDLKVNFEKMALCMGDDLGGFKNNIFDVGGDSYYLHTVLPCTVKLKGSATTNTDFSMVLDCTEIDNEEYRTNIIMRMSDYTQARDLWVNLNVSSVVDADKKTLTINLRL